MQSASGATGPARSVKRRSARIKLKIPITLRAAGDSVLQAETVSVSKHGAKIRITSVCEKLDCGLRMSVTTRAGQPRAQVARVVWLDKTNEPHCGIELDQPDNFWGVYFPSKDGDNGRPGNKFTEPAKHAAPASTPEVPDGAIHPGEVCITPRLAEALLQDEATDTRTLPARVTGFTATRLPLSESVDIVFTRPDEATALFRDPVEPGTNVRFVLRERVVLGRVAAVGVHRQAGKWRVRIKCDAPCF